MFLVLYCNCSSNKKMHANVINLKPFKVFDLPIYMFNLVRGLSEKSFKKGILNQTVWKPIWSAFFKCRISWFLFLFLLGELVNICTHPSSNYLEAGVHTLNQLSRGRMCCQKAVEKRYKIKKWKITSFHFTKINNSSFSSYKR